MESWGLGPEWCPRCGVVSKPEPPKTLTTDADGADGGAESSTVTEGKSAWLVRSPRPDVAG